MSGPTSCFTYEALPMRVVFGAGVSSRLVDELDALGLVRVLVLCSPEQRTLAEQISGSLGERSVGVHPGAVMHVHADAAARAGELARRLGADACLAVGGGSTTGLGKIVALRHALPVVAVPTTYAGSEMTPMAFAPAAAQICTPNTPSPPDAPQTSTFCPGCRRWPWWP